MEKETFLTLIQDLAHWEFEIFLMVLFDGVIGFLLWGMLLRPLWNRWFRHHKEDDNKLATLEKNRKEDSDKIAELERRLKKLEKKEEFPAIKVG